MLHAQNLNDDDFWPFKWVFFHWKSYKTRIYLGFKNFYFFLLIISIRLCVSVWRCVCVFLWMNICVFSWVVYVCIYGHWDLGLFLSLHLNLRVRDYVIESIVLLWMCVCCNLCLTLNFCVLNSHLSPRTMSFVCIVYKSKFFLMNWLMSLCVMCLHV
jgi:hypothetical protein